MTSIYLAHEVMRKPAEMKRIGIYHQGRLITFNHKDPRLPGFSNKGWTDPNREPYSYANIADLIDAAFSSKAGSLWLLPSNEPDPLIDNFKVPAATDTMTYRPISMGGKRSLQLAGCSARALVDGVEKGAILGCYNLAVEEGEVFGMGGVLPPDETSLMQALCLASFTLNIQLRFSPSYTGLAILREELQRWKDLPQMSPDMRAWIADKLPHPISWVRKITDDDPPADPATIWHYDRNSSYVSSFRVVPLGDPIRAPEYEVACHSPDHAVLLPKNFPYVARIAAIPPADWPQGMPGLFYSDGMESYPLAFQGWAWGPQIRLAVQSGWVVDIHECHIWREYHDLGRSWQTRLWDARRAATAYPDPVVSKAAVSIIKMCGVAGIGRLLQSVGHAVMTREQAESEGRDIVWHDRVDGVLTGTVGAVVDTGRNDLHQAGWWAYIIANAVERVQAHMLLAARQGAGVIGAWTDSIYCLAEVPQLDGDKLKTGGWRLAGKATAPRATIPHKRLDMFVSQREGK